ncbi:MAG TPA: SHOCT domain-containing protein [Actinomycetes bacterium]|nr:SHOCT domain-containing protein [Actinomycetes bacterium]
MVVADWTFGTVLWSMLVFFFWFAFIWLFITVFADILRRHDLSGWAKTGWIVLIVLVPFLGALIYLIARPPVAAQELQTVGFGGGGSGYSAASEIAKAGDLRDRGLITDDQFEEIKRRAVQ